MATYVALIRAIGPVTHRVMRMAALREACEVAGLMDVTTVGNTGNVLFRAPLMADAARRKVQDAVRGFGLDNEVFIRTPAEMAEVVAANPFATLAAERPAEIGVCSFHEAPDWTPVTEGYDGPERVATVGAHLVVAYPEGIADSRLRIEKRLEATMTMRNWTVFAGLAAKAASLG